MFAERGFEETTVKDVAEAVGVSRRTLFRYYPSKNDIVWGEFDESLAGIRQNLADASPDEPLIEAIRRAVVAFNDYRDDELPELRIRVRLITSVPALQAHSNLRYREWGAVIAEFVAARLDRHPEDHLPQLIANVTLGIWIATQRHWITHPESDLLGELDEAFRLLAAGFDDAVLRDTSQPN
jgi:TetR/AcrR family transcriptional regulator, regulator of mycofactocin system